KVDTGFRKRSCSTNRLVAVGVAPLYPLTRVTPRLDRGDHPSWQEGSAILLRWAIACARLFILVVLLAAMAGAQAVARSRVAFNLFTQHGAAFTERDIAGLPTALFFGFTFCPDICPT